MKKLINRPQYLNRLIASKDTEQVKVVTGVRFCGKASLLALYREYLLQQGVSDSHIFHIHMASPKFRELTHVDALYNFIHEHISSDGKTYLLLDEVLAMGQWERELKALQEDFDVDLYITCSNDYWLTEEFTHFFGDSYTEIRVLPLSFKEFLQFHKFSPEMTVNEKFERYLKVGGLPVFSDYPYDEDRYNQLMDGMYHTILVKDILPYRHMYTDFLIAIQLITVLSSTMGHVLTKSRIGDYLGKLIYDQSDTLKDFQNKQLNNYISMVEKAFLSCIVDRFDVEANTVLKSRHKIYTIDLAFYNFLVGYKKVATRDLIENLVYLELHRRHNKVYFGRVRYLHKVEYIDLVAEKEGKKVYIQVAESLNSFEGKGFRIPLLQQAPDDGDKIILTLDKGISTTPDGIKCMNVIDWLLSDE